MDAKIKLVLECFKFGSLITGFFVIAACSPDSQEFETRSLPTVINSVEKKQTTQKIIPASEVGKLFSNDDEGSVLVEQAIVRYRQLVDDSLQSNLPLILLSNVEGDAAKLAQSLAANDPRVRQTLYHSETRQALRNEVMVVRKALPADLIGSARECSKGACYRVDIYNFYTNVTTSAVVDTTLSEVKTVNSLPETQPDLSSRLKKLAIKIAKSSPLVQKEIKNYLPDKGQSEIQPVMAEIKSALKNTLCERSKHLCVAPTYLLGDRALWVIVDLTDMRVVGVRWTELRDSGPPIVVSQRSLENEFVFHNYCQRINKLDRSGWSFKYLITGSDGIEVSDVTFEGKAVFASSKLVDWHVSYSRKESFGYSDAIGCPLFSSAVVVAYNGPKQEDIIVDGETIGFAFIQDFRQHAWPAACNYRYEQRYEFYNDGRFRIVVGNLGRGCGDDGTYRPVIRLQMDQAYSTDNSIVEAWQGNEWQTWSKEQWSSQKGRVLKNNRFSHRIHRGNGSSYLLEPGNRQFGDGGRGDDALIYATVFHADKDEGQSDLVTLGSCCNIDYQQGPEKFMQPAELLNNQGLVLWYVAQIKNDGRKGQEYCWSDTVVEKGVKKIKVWPCYAGPMFTPVKLK